MQGTAREQVPYWGVDSRPEDRPGVPMEMDPPRAAEGAHWQKPDRQPTPDYPVYKRVEISRLTPGFGTMQPPHGVSGLLRRTAYNIAEHKPTHWALLLVADRIDVVESKLGGAKALTLLGAAAGGFTALRRMGETTPAHLRAATVGHPSLVSRGF